MLTLSKYEAKTKEDAYEKCSNEHNLEDMFIKEQELQGGIFKSKKYILEVIGKNEVKNYIKDYISNIDKSFKIDIKSEVNEKDNIIKVNLISNNNPILIGKDGKTVESLQTLIKNSIKNSTGLDIKINIDVSDYKAKKEKHFEKEIKNIIKDILKTHIDVKLDPMNSYKRRIVHNLVSNYKELKTESVGQEPKRYTIIKYVGEEDR